MVICVDFDGTCVTHEYPRMGKDIGALPVLRKIIAAGHNIILFTMRSDQSGNQLTNAVTWFANHVIPLYGVNRNPTQHAWTSSPKALADLYIDDAALGCPLIYNTKISSRPYVDWNKVEEMLIARGIIS